MTINDSINDNTTPDIIIIIITSTSTTVADARVLDLCPVGRELLLAKHFCGVLM